jgi:hypothetical protein
MIGVRTGGPVALRALKALILVIVLCGFAAPTALAAEGERVFDPKLSLIGGCAAETLDSVEDPGCPTTPPPSPHPPSGFFADPRAVATDFHGNIYVASFGNDAEGTEGRIDIFDPTGVFLEELEPQLPCGETVCRYGPMSLAIDSKGVLYVVVLKPDVTPDEKQVLRYNPCVYEPEAGNIEYCNPPVVLIAEPGIRPFGLAIDAENDHLFANSRGSAVIEYTSAEEGNGAVRTIQARGIGVAVDAARDRLYASLESGEVRRIDIFDLSSVVGTPPGDEYEKIDSIEESAVPGGDLGNLLSVAVDEASGHIFVFDTENAQLYEFDANGDYVATIEFDFQPELAVYIGADNGPTSPNKGVLYVPSHKTGIGHVFAFKESQVGPPEVKSPEALNISEEEAELVAQVNPKNLPTTYTIHYLTTQLFEQNVKEAEAPFAGATLAGEGDLAAGNLDVEVSAALTGLNPGTSYRFRVFAENAEGEDEEQASFATYPSFPVNPLPCPNALLRTGPSALLPDCRAYELVTPPDTNGRVLRGTGTFGNVFTNRQVSPGGGALPFKVEGGSLPGFGGTGSVQGDPYLAKRTASGWSTTYIGPSGAEATSIIAGTGSPDQGYSFWHGEGSGTAVLGGPTSYVRFPDGHFELVGQGSLGIDPKAVGRLISEGGDHIIFTSGGNSPAVQLEPNAAPPLVTEEENEEGEMEVVEIGTDAIYDRVPNPETGKRETKVISLKPGDEPFGEGDDALYMGASLDGEGVAFEVKGTLYLRYQNAETFAIASGVEFAGLAEGGARIFYLQGGDLKAFDATSPGESITFTTSGDARPVYVAANGTAAYFVSPSVLTPGELNPNEAEAQLGAQNLYLSEEGQISFVATVTDRDVNGALTPGIGFLDGLGLWVTAASSGRFGIVPARASADGSVLLFKSRAKLSDYDPDESAQIYRYDSLAGELQCLSCNPTGAPSESDATLQSENRTENIALFGPLVWPENLRADGRRAFFESSEPLVPGDSDGLKDVYEWEAEGVGSCTAPAPRGCLYLISSPQSLSPEFLWAVSESGNDVFFLSSELLVGSDADQTPSIYDARVGGGFPEASPPICMGEGCRPRQTPAPPPPAVQTLAESTEANFKPKRCAKGKRKVKRGGKVRCVKKKKQRRRKGGRR